MEKRIFSVGERPRDAVKFFLENLINQGKLNNIFTHEGQIDFLIHKILREIRNYLTHLDLKLLDHLIDELALHYFFIEEQIMDNTAYISTINLCLKITAQEFKIINDENELLKLDQAFTKFFNYIISKMLIKIRKLRIVYSENIKKYEISGSYFNLKNHRKKIRQVDIVDICKISIVLMMKKG